MSDRPFRVAVTGVGGGSGQSILKALIESPLLMDIFTLDMTPLSAGLYWPGATGQMLPKPEENLEVWKSWLAFNAIDLLIPGTDRDLIPLAAVAEEWKTGHICRVAVSSPEMVALADDKAKTVDWLMEHGFCTPKSNYDLRGVINKLDAAIGWIASHVGFPCIIKERNGAASRGFHICKDIEELAFYWRHSDNPMAQEYIEGDEYTCALFFDIHHQPVAKFALKRWLRGGDTYRAEVVNNPQLNLFLDTVGEKLTALKPFGPINVQLRERDGKFYVLEFNARCSGTTAMRAHFGYNEPDMLVRHICLREDITQPTTRSGFVFRVWGEMYLDGVSEAQLMGVKAEAVI